MSLKSAQGILQEESATLVTQHPLQQLNRADIILSCSVDAIYYTSAQCISIFFQGHKVKKKDS